MNPHQFWDEDPDDLWAYWDAYEQTKKIEQEEDNVRAFNQGQYFLLALSEVLQFSKHPKKIYPKKPLELKSGNKKQPTQKEYEEIRKIQAKAMVERFNSHKK